MKVTNDLQSIQEATFEEYKNCLLLLKVNKLVKIVLNLKQRPHGQEFKSEQTEFVIIWEQPL